MDVKTAELGQEFSQEELSGQCKAIYGAVAWPNESAGFAVVVGMDKKEHFDSHDIYLLDEYESFDMRELVRKCGALNFKYKPERWVGQRDNDAADRLIREMNAELEPPEGYQESIYGRDLRRWRMGLSLTPSPMFDMNSLYQYILPQIRRLLDPERRQLFLKDSKVLDQLGAMTSNEQNDISKFELGKYPAIEALAFAVIEMRLRYSVSDSDSDVEQTDMAESYSLNSVL